MALALGLCTSLACEDQNLGVPPPDDQLVFPSGLLMDPRPRPAGETIRWLFVANANSALSYSAGTVVAVDLDAFWAEWFDEETGQTDPYCHHDHDAADPAKQHEGRCVQPAGAALDADHPCRHMATNARIIECDESNFVKASVHVGHFGTVLGHSLDGSKLRLWLPVRGDPSITYIDVRGGVDEIPRFFCEQGDDDKDPDKCGDLHRLTHLRNDDDLVPLGREPFNILISPDPDINLGYVTHAGGGRATLIDLEWIGPDGRKRPAIVDQIMLFDLTGIIPGGYGLAQHPCPEENAPLATRGCTRPLVYGSFRYGLALRSVTAARLDPTAEPLPTGTDVDTGTDPAAGNDPQCADEDEIGEPGKVACDPQFEDFWWFGIAGLDPSPGSSLPVLGDVAFGDPRGDRLYVVQTNPGALIAVDTSLDDDGVPHDRQAGAPVEVCSEPTNMELFDDGLDRYALISCFRSAYVFVVDLDRMAVVQQIIAGTGPHDLVVDYERGAVYAANTLEATISVIDISRDRATRFTELARIGLQDPFSR
jgi:hypothetical protein